MEGKDVRFPHTHQQTFSERVRAFSQHASWDNFKAIFVGRTVTIVQTPEKQIYPKNQLDISYPDRKPREVSKAEELQVFTPRKVIGPLPSVKKMGGQYGEDQHHEALGYIQRGQFDELATLIRGIEKEGDFIAMRNFLLEKGAVYNCTDDDGQHCAGAEAIIREVSVKFDNGHTRRLKETPSINDQSQAIPLSTQLQEQFSNLEDFEALRDTLYNDGYYTHPQIMAAVQQHSRTFDSQEELTAKDLVVNYKQNPMAFQQHVEASFKTSEAVEKLRDNLDENGFLMQEHLHGFKWDEKLKGEGSVLRYLNRLHSGLFEAEQQQARAGMLTSTDEDAIKRWLTSSVTTREDAAALIAKAKYNQNATTIATQLLQSHYQSMLSNEIIDPVLAAGHKFAESQAYEDAKEEYEKLNSDTEHDLERDIQIKLASESPELKQMLVRLSREEIPSDNPDQLTTRASLEELSRLEEAIDRSDLPIMAKDVTRRVLFLARETVEKALYEKISYQFSHGITDSLTDELMLLEHQEDFDRMAGWLEDDLKQDFNDRRVSRNDYIAQNRMLQGILQRTRAKLFQDNSRQ